MNTRLYVEYSSELGKSVRVYLTTDGLISMARFGGSLPDALSELQDLETSLAQGLEAVRQAITDQQVPA